MDISWIDSWLLSHGIRILAIIIVAIILYLLLRHFVPRLVQTSVSRQMRGHGKKEIQQRASTLSSVFRKTGLIIIAIVAIFTMLPEFGINIGALLAGFGILGIALGFGAQSLIKDILNGTFILLEDQYRIGDVVEIAGIAGSVEEINLRRTVLRDFDGKVHSIPNGEITIATNFTKGYSRVNMNISVGYGEDLDHVIEVINRVCQGMTEDPKWKADFVNTPQVLRVDKLGDSGIEIKILGNTKPGDQWSIKGELRLRLKKAFDREGIEIPWPHTKVYFGNELPMKPENTKKEQGDNQ